MKITTGDLLRAMHDAQAKMSRKNEHRGLILTAMEVLMKQAQMIQDLQTALTPPALEAVEPSVESEHAETAPDAL